MNDNLVDPSPDTLSHCPYCQRDTQGTIWIETKHYWVECRECYKIKYEMGQP